MRLAGRTIILTALILSAFAVIAQTAPKQEAAPVAKAVAPKIPPAVPVELKAKYYRAQLSMRKAQEAMQSAQAEFQSMAKEFETACGTEYQPQVDPNGDPLCLEKPASANPAKK